LKGLGAAVARQATEELAQGFTRVDDDGFVDIDNALIEADSSTVREGSLVRDSFLDRSTIVVDVAVGTIGERTRL
jgi:hypothetical protein